MKTPSTEVGPGMWAFVAFFVLALALWLLMRSMFGRLRRINLAERDREQAERERGERAGLAATVILYEAPHRLAERGW